MVFLYKENECQIIGAKSFATSVKNLPNIDVQEQQKIVAHS